MGDRLASVSGLDRRAFCVGLSAAASVGGAARARDPKAAPLLTPVATLTAHGRGVSAAALSADGATALTGGRDRTLRVWDLDAFTERARFEVRWSLVGALALGPDGALGLAAGDYGELHAFRTSDGAVRHDLRSVTSAVRVARMLPAPPGLEAVRAVTGEGRGVVRLWDLARGRELQVIANSASVASLAVSADGGLGLSGDERGRLRLWRLADGRLLAEAAPHARLASAVALSPDGAVAYSGGGDGAVVATRLADGAPIWRRQLPSGPATAAALSADAARLILAGARGALTVLDSARGTPLETVEAAHRGGVSALEISADGARMISAGADGRLRVWALA